MNLDDRIGDFKQDLRAKNISEEQIFQKHLIDAKSYYFHNILNQINLEYAVKSQISTAFDVSLNEVILVGSGKIGFSLKPKFPYREFDALFKKTKLQKEKSDLDIAIISPKFFEDTGVRLYRFTDGLRNKWDSNLYYQNSEERRKEIPLAYKCFEYYTKGWLRPDFVPLGFELGINESMENLKLTLYNNLNKRKISFGFYKNWYYFKEYHIDNIINLRLQLQNNLI